MSGVALAVGLGTAAVGYIGSQNSARAQTNAANQANATQQGQYNQTRQDQLPWMNRGNAAGNQMAYLLGLPGYGPQNVGTWAGSSSPINMSAGVVGPGGDYIPTPGTWSPNGPEGRSPHPRPDGISDNDWAAYGPTQDASGAWSDGWNGGQGQQGPANQFNTSMGAYGSLSTPFSQTNWQQDPGYAFRLAEGQKALERSGAAKGMTLSGAQAKALTGYGQGMASQEYGNAYNRYTTDQTNLYNRLAGVAGTGQTAANQIGNVGMNTANQISSNQLGAGNANAAAWTAGTGALANGLNSWGNFNAWNSLNRGNTFNTQGTLPGEF